MHRFQSHVSGIMLPSRFTYPMHYVPHELSKIAAREVMDFALSQQQWHDELMAGKMMGVLVVKDGDGRLGYLAAYSGNLHHSDLHGYFVPHVYNLLEPHGLFRTGEAQITQINQRIKALESSPARQAMELLIADIRHQQEQEVLSMRQAIETAKASRDKQRSECVLEPQQEAALVRQSQFMKAELRRLRKRHREQLAAEQQRLDDYDATIFHLKQERKAMSERLQRQLFKLFVVRNAHGQSMDVATIFEQRLHRLPPAGTGDCCAPKLLQYAFLHGLTPVCMAEFWVGRSPQGEVRHHGHFYPACRSKCLPLMEFMLQGLDVENNRLSEGAGGDHVEVIYHDQWLIVAVKPAGMLTVPGKDHGSTSLLDVVGEMLGDGEQALEVHRLDQATSGLVVIAKTREVQKRLRQQFEHREVRKSYVAQVDGVPIQHKGTIALPLRPDHDDRPRQVVDFEHGKEAITQYQVLEHRGSKALVELTPLTGRTHQLRVHASHPQGLNCPITGDMLYGTANTRLYLHAQSLSFTHPATGEVLSFKNEAPFITTQHEQQAADALSY